MSALSALTGRSVIGVFHTLSAGKAGQEVPGSTGPEAALSVPACPDEVAADDGTVTPRIPTVTAMQTAPTTTPTVCPVLCLFDPISFTGLMALCPLCCSVFSVAASATHSRCGGLGHRAGHIPHGHRPHALLFGQPVELVEQLLE